MKGYSERISGEIEGLIFVKRVVYLVKNRIDDL
jgi:hypothetical protein